MAYISFQPSDYFNTKLWTGTGSENAQTGIGFQPDFTWIKRREVNSHRLFDSVRGATKLLESDATAAETTDAQELKSFDSDGFTLGTGTKVNKMVERMHLGIGKQERLQVFQVEQHQLLILLVRQQGFHN